MEFKINDGLILNINIKNKWVKHITIIIKFQIKTVTPTNDTGGLTIFFQWNQLMQKVNLIPLES
jgi:hypothetical protein